MKNKGFTLIELLAVILILAVIALIATPLIMGTITKAKKNAMKDTAYGILKAGEQYVGEKLAEANNDYPGETITLPNQDKIQYKGGNGITGELKITRSGKLAIQIHNNQFCAMKNLGDDEVTVTDYDEETCKLDNVPESISFAEDSWETIAANIRVGNIENYHVGDTKEVNMGEFGTHVVRIANTSTPLECNQESFSQTACGFVIEFTDIITVHVMNSTNTNVGGWPESELHSYIQNDIYNSLPIELRNEIINTKVVSGHGLTESANFTSTDKLYLLSTKEVYGSSGSYDSLLSETRQLDYYQSQRISTSNYSGAIKQYNNSNFYWWTRVPLSNNNTSFYSVYAYGDWGYYSYANSSSGVSPAFRIG